jgi:hypothetical protein
MRKALADDNLLGKALPGDTWRPWRVLLIASMGEALTDDERVIFTALTGREREPGRRVEELIGVIGRRGGKSKAIATLATYLAGLCEWPSLVAGEVGVGLIIAPDVAQAGVCLAYTDATFTNSPVLHQLIRSRTATKLRLANGLEIQTRASDHRRLRGPSYIFAIGDESAFWLDGERSQNPDAAIVQAVRPALATTHGPLILISSPHARRGELWSIYRRHFGPTGDPAILVAQAPSRTMNASLAQSVVDRAIERDPAAAAAEFGAQFRSDLEQFVAREAIEACIVTGVRERLPESGLTYTAFVDPSGGSSDSMTLCVAHYDVGRSVAVVDAVREACPPFSPEAVTAEFAVLLKTYRISTIKGDRYAGLWPREAFAHHGLLCDVEDVAPKSAIYTDALALINSARCELPDLAKLVNQLTSLERRVGRGRATIDHPPGMHDDVANAVCGAVVHAVGSLAYDHEFRGWSYAGDHPDPGIERGRRAQRLMQTRIAEISRPPLPPGDLLAQIERLKAQRRNACFGD